MRYSRQLLLPELGEEGQKRLKNGKVLVIGAGGLGSPALMYLAAAGVGTIGIADADTVEISNLNRQIIHTTAAIGMPKVDSAKERILALNPNVQVIVHKQFATEENIDALIAPYDFVIDATDGVAAKYLINDACVRAEKAYSHGGVFGWQGQTFTHIPGSAELRSFFPTLPCPTKAAQPIIGTTAGIIGVIEATEAIKFLAQLPTLNTNRLLCFNALKMDFDVLSV